MRRGRILHRDIQHARFQKFGYVLTEAVFQTLDLHYVNSPLSNALPSVV